MDLDSLITKTAAAAAKSVAALSEAGILTDETIEAIARAALSLIARAAYDDALACFGIATEQAAATQRAEDAARELRPATV